MLRWEYKWKYKDEKEMDIMEIMEIKLMNIGFGNMIVVNRVIAIVKPESSPARRIIQEARNRHMLITATQGRKMKSIIVTDIGYVILSSILPETLAHRQT